MSGIVLCCVTQRLWNCFMAYPGPQSGWYFSQMSCNTACAQDELNKWSYTVYIQLSQEGNHGLCRTVLCNLASLESSTSILEQTTLHHELASNIKYPLNSEKAKTDAILAASYKRAKIN
jgi:hypothetical protein